MFSNSSHAPEGSPRPEQVADRMRVVSYGGGVQSTALLVLAAEGRIGHRTFLFANVGDDSEHPATLNYLRQIAMPFAAEHGIEMKHLAKTKRDGTIETLMDKLVEPEARSIPIPVRMRNGAPGRRACTADFKIKVVGRWLRSQGATAAAPADVAIGISLDEIHRANRRRSEKHERIEYPLLDLGLRRTDCEQIIAEAGLPVPPKSACFFCPFKTVGSWRQQRLEEPELFAKSVRLEMAINERRRLLGRDEVFLSRYGRPLDEAIAVADPEAADGEIAACDSGWCMT